MSNYSLFKTTHLYFFLSFSPRIPLTKEGEKPPSPPPPSLLNPPLLPLSKNVSRLVSTFPFHVSRKRTSKVHYAIASLVIRRTFYMGGGYYIFFVIISCRFSLSLSLSLSLSALSGERERKEKWFVLGGTKKNDGGVPGFLF